MSKTPKFQISNFTTFFQKIINFATNKNNYKVILPILVLVIAILFTSIFYFQNNPKTASNSQNSQNQIQSEKDCQNQNGRYLLGQNGFECVFISVSSSQTNSQTSSYNQSAEEFKYKENQQKLAQSESQKIDQMTVSLKKIDLTKFYKPFVFDGHALTDQTNRIIPIFDYQKDPSLNLKVTSRIYLKSIYAESEKKIYTPFWNGQIAALDLATGQIAWQNTGLEILDMSLFNGKYYIVTSDCKSANGQQDCSIFEIDRQTLQKRQIYQAENKSIGATGGLGPCGQNIRQVVFADKEFFYLNGGCFEAQITKYRLDNGKFVIAYSMGQWPCCHPHDYTDYSFDITEQRVDFFDSDYTNQQFSEGERTLNDEKILLQGKIPKEEVEFGNWGEDNFKRNEEKIRKFYKPADDFWQKLFPFDTFPDKMKAGQCGKFVWFLEENGELEVKFNGLKIENSYQNLQCIN